MVILSIARKERYICILINNGTSNHLRLCESLNQIFHTITPYKILLETVYEFLIVPSLQCTLTQSQSGVDYDIIVTICRSRLVSVTYLSPLLRGIF